MEARIAQDEERTRSTRYTGAGEISVWKAVNHPVLHCSIHIQSHPLLDPSRTRGVLPQRVTRPYLDPISQGLPANWTVGTPSSMSLEKAFEKLSRSACCPRVMPAPAHSLQQRVLSTKHDSVNKLKTHSLKKTCSSLAYCSAYLRKLLSLMSAMSVLHL